MKKATDVEETSPDLLSILEEHEEALKFSRFDTQVAWDLGTRLRQRFIDEKIPKGFSAAIQIIALTQGSSTKQHPLVLFGTTVGPAVAPGIGSLVAGKANVVAFSGKSSFLSRTQFKTYGIDLVEFGLASPEYFMHGGGFPIRLTNHSTPIAVIVVSGMPSQAEDHQIIVDTLIEFLPTLT